LAFPFLPLDDPLLGEVERFFYFYYLSPFYFKLYLFEANIFSNDLFSFCLCFVEPSALAIVVVITTGPILILLYELSLKQLLIYFISLALSRLDM